MWCVGIAVERNISSCDCGNGVCGIGITGGVVMEVVGLVAVGGAAGVQRYDISGGLWFSAW